MANSPVNTSATGGFLKPTSGPVDYDRELDLQVQALVVGVTGLVGELVRRRYQLKPPAQPELTVDWCAVGVMRITPEAGGPAVLHYGAGEGHDKVIRHETLEVLASFYGPNATGYATMLREGLTLAQNREQLGRWGMGYVDTDPLINASTFQNTQWLRRIDLTFRLRRRVERTYAVLNVKEVDGTIHANGGSSDGPTAAELPFHVEFE